MLRLAYLALTNTFALIRMLPMSDRDTDVEILALRHQLAVLQRKVGKPAFTPNDRTLLAALLYHLPTQKLRQLHLLMPPDTILRWHRGLLNQRHAATGAPRRRGRQRTVRSIRALVLRLARENRSWGYRRIHGELTALGIKIAASTVWEILKEHGVEPAPGRAQTTWATFLRSQAEALLACDFFETRTLSGARLHVFAVIEHATRRIRILGPTAHPTAAWATQLARNLAMDLEDTRSKAKFMIRDRDCKFTAAFDTVLHDVGLRVVLTGIQMPRMNSIMERWVQTCRHELLASETGATSCTPSGSSSTSTTSNGPTEPSGLLHPCAHYPKRSPILSGSRTSMSADETDSAALSTSIDMLPDQHG